MTSNWFVAILSSTGVFGAGLLLGFILRLYILRCRSADPRTREFAMGLKFALVPYFAMQAAAALTPDIGVPAGSSAEHNVLCSPDFDEDIIEKALAEDPDGPSAYPEFSVVYVMGCVTAAFSSFIARGIFLWNGIKAYRYLLGRMCARTPARAFEPPARARAPL